MNLLRAVATVSSLTFVSRVLGFVRDFFIARTFGRSVHRWSLATQAGLAEPARCRCDSARAAGPRGDWRRVRVPE